MHPKPLTVSAGASLVEAIESIFEYKLTGLTVVDETGQVVGILSELDCIKGVLNAIYNEGDPEHALVRDAMCREVVSCAPGDSIVEVAQSMLDSHQRRRPVMENGKLVGQVSSSNVLWALMEHSRRKIFNRGR
jgi:CBS domain-containing protein